MSLKTVVQTLLVLAVMVIPAVAFAKPAPGDAGGSPEPMTWMLMAAGAIPAFLAYRWVRRRQQLETAQ